MTNTMKTVDVTMAMPVVGEIRVVRSPAKICWHVKRYDQLLVAMPTKREAEAKAEDLRKMLGGWRR